MFETVVFTDGLWFFVRNVLAVKSVVLLGHLSLFLAERFVLNLEEVSELLHGDLSFGKILKQMIDQYFPDVFAGKLPDFCGDEHLPELYFVYRSVLVGIELVKENDRTRVVLYELLQFVQTDPYNLLFHIFLPRFVFALLFLSNYAT